jgi:hypothetical protein
MKKNKMDTLCNDCLRRQCFQRAALAGYKIIECNLFIGKETASGSHLDAGPGGNNTNTPLSLPSQ